VHHARAGGSARAHWSSNAEHAGLDDIALIDNLAEWSAWASFAEVGPLAPRLPGVYQFRVTGQLMPVYVGMAGERRGMGLRGRLSMYRRGKAATSGFGEAVLDRALADEAFVARQLDRLREEGPQRTSAWARDAVAWFSPDIRWAVTADSASALLLEAEVEKVLRPHGIWNRPRNLD
jgi:hypothetical protein